MFCGATLRRGTESGYELSFSDYLAQIKPIAVKANAADERLATTSDVWQLKGLLGQLQRVYAAMTDLECSI